MYGLAKDTDLAAFVGCELEVVSIGLHQVNLIFDGLRQIGISIEGGYAVSDSHGEQTRYSAARDGASSLAALLGVKVEDARVEAHGTTALLFADGSAITVYDSESHYESYQIHIGERLIVV